MDTISPVIYLAYLYMQVTYHFTILGMEIHKHYRHISFALNINHMNISRKLPFCERIYNLMSFHKQLMAFIQTETVISI